MRLKGATHLAQECAEDERAYKGKETERGKFLAHRYSIGDIRMQRSMT